eukprot:365970-Chlamydomonas_euryale.AAC.8
MHKRRIAGAAEQGPAGWGKLSILKSMATGLQQWYIMAKGCALAAANHGSDVSSVHEDSMKPTGQRGVM